jgi:hypothetical protein
MDTSWGPPPFRFGGPPRPSTDPDMRVSDAERTEMTDILSKHYADGRLDESEFKVRLDKAMSAKTRRDLSGLLNDLPPLHPEPARPKHLFVTRVWWAFSAVAVFALAIALLSVTSPAHFPWGVVLIVFAILWFRRSGRYGYRHHHHHHHNDPDY